MERAGGKVFDGQFIADEEGYFRRLFWDPLAPVLHGFRGETGPRVSGSRNLKNRAFPKKTGTLFFIFAPRGVRFSR